MVSTNGAIWVHRGVSRLQARIGGMSPLRSAIEPAARRRVGVGGSVWIPRGLTAAALERLVSEESHERHEDSGDSAAPAATTGQTLAPRAIPHALDDIAQSHAASRMPPPSILFVVVTNRLQAYRPAFKAQTVNPQRASRVPPLPRGDNPRALAKCARVIR